MNPVVVPSARDDVSTAVARALAALPPGGIADQAASVRARLAEPALRVAVGGRVNAGKSTLVNALLGQRLAATGSTETTTVVTWFRYHHQNRVVVRRRGHPDLVVPAAPGGGAPATLPPGVTDVDALVVEVSNRRLAERYAVVDTPGLDSSSGLDDVAMAALREADVLLYVMPHPGQRDLEALSDLRGAAKAEGLSALTVVGVLSRIDTLDSGRDDPWPTAHRLARRNAASLRGLVSTVLPVVGLLAETALGDRFTQRDVRLLADLSAGDPDDLDDNLTSGGDFLDWSGAPITGDDRRRLLELLGLYGVRTAVEILAGQAPGSMSAAQLLDALVARSGFAALTDHLDAHFVRTADRLRAWTAIRALSRIGWAGANDAERAALHTLRADLDRVTHRADLRQLSLVPALTELAEGRLELPDDAAEALVALVTGGPDGSALGLPPDAGATALRDAADRWIGRWRELEDAPSRLVARRARAARELCEAIFFTSRPNSGPTE